MTKSLDISNYFIDLKEKRILEISSKSIKRKMVKVIMC